ncbi:MAG TPA: terminase small subunit, partial [Dehalococcoidia bacterium]|nr:terminase small subunit [Dehalococcoidia bacterium]
MVDLNASRAARDVGYAPKSASVEGSRLLANAEVQAEITRQRAILMEQSNVTPEKIV